MEASLERLSGEVAELRREVASMKGMAVEQRSLCASLAEEVRQVPQLEARVGEMQGVQAAFDAEQRARFQEMAEFKESAEGRLNSLATDVRTASSTAKGDLRRARDDLEEKIAEPQRAFRRDLKEVKSQLHAEIQLQASKTEGQRTEMMHVMHNLERGLEKLRQELNEAQRRCDAHAETRVAELRGDVDERSRLVNEAFETERQMTLSSQAELEAALKDYTNTLCTPLGLRIDDANTLLEQTHKDLSDDIDKAKESAKQEARFSTEMALKRVDDHLQAFVHKASDALLERVKGVPREALAQQLKEQPEDIIEGFRGLLARESVDAELQTMVDRALHRLQLVSDDLSHRSCRLQEHIDASELRIKTYLGDALVNLEARPKPAGDGPEAPEDAAQPEPPPPPPPPATTS
eukprot:TRINITY_DN25050_c0_g1_i1.p1 TRINITY_DN25050_c0_g1~~TRINITY_DN25050_c0_g1_i1.p1  ORF type:complete len:407 (-),score=118.05 TRINITY_DN25050_c0_g1_i1:48-1268(-)